MICRRDSVYTERKKDLLRMCGSSVETVALRDLVCLAYSCRKSEFRSYFSGSKFEVS